MRPTPDAVRAALAAHARIEVPALPGRTNHLRAGVLVPLLWRPRLVTLVTLRPRSMSLHAGEICFPGGRPEPEDPSLEATARREAEEELGLATVEVIGRLSSIPLFTSDYRLEPFVALVPDTELAPHAREVERVIEIEIGAVLRRPALDAIAWTLEGTRHLSPVLELEGHVMFGATAHAFLELLHVLAPLDAAQVPPLVPGRFEWDFAAGRPRRA